MKNILQISSLIALLSGCSSNENPAEIERKDSLFYGRSGTYKVQEHKSPFSSSANINAPHSEISEKPLPKSISHDAYQQDDVLQEDIKSSTAPKSLVEPVIKEKPAVEEESVIKESDDEEGFDLATLHKESSSEKVIIEEAPKEPEQILRIQPTDSYKIAHPLGDANFSWPIQGNVTEHWGGANTASSEGITIAAPVGTIVKASAAGEVTYVGHDNEYGNLVIIKHSNDVFTAYAYNSKISVAEGAKIIKGQPIAYSGKTGNASEPQLYFSMRKGANTVDPEKPL